MESIANKLPFDVLCIIFEYFTLSDRFLQPQLQETLLLVSRSWYNTASNHAILWTNIDLFINHLDEIRYWASCLARRLIRYSANALLDVQINTAIHDTFRRGEWASHQAIERLLLTLVGESGAFAQRWRRFVVGDTFRRVSPTTLGFCFSFLTPNLEEFSAGYLPRDQEILPDTSSLKSFSIIECTLPKYPNLETVTDLDILLCKRTPGLEYRIDEHAVGLARNLRSLKINTTKRYRLCGTYPHLKSLHLQGTIYEDCLTKFDAPNLTDLSLIVYFGRDYLSVVSCAGIQPGEVKTARIGIEYRAIKLISSYFSGLCQFLTQLVNLETLILDDSDVVQFALKLLTGECEHLCQSHTLRLVFGNCSGKLGKGEARLPSVDAFRQQTGCLEDGYVYHLLSS